MAQSSYKASAPGSIFLTGEHAVLHGKAAIVCAIDQRITVTLIPNQTKCITLNSEKFGKFETKLNNIEITKPYHFILTALSQFPITLPSGFSLTIESEFSHEMGLGSSAAVTVATIAALQKWLPGEINLDNIFQLAKKAILTIQGHGSSADTAASVYGGTLFYRAQPLEIEKLKYNPPLSLVYSGSKMPTPEVIAIIEKNRQQSSDKFAQLFAKIEKTSLDAKLAISRKDWQQLGKVCNIAHDLMKQLGASNDLLDIMTKNLCKKITIFGAKISGAGLGDCVVGIGKPTIGISEFGVRSEST